MRRLSQEKVADAIGVSVSYLSRLETGDRNISGKLVKRLVSFFGCEPGDLFTPDEPNGIVATPIQNVTVIGQVEAGSWQEALEWDEARRYLIAVPMLRSTAKSVFGLEVHGVSMNLEYRPGDVVVCVPLMEYHDELQNGKHVVCQRTCANGLIEATIKEYQKDGNGNVWLWPRSTDPEHQQPIRLPRHSVSAEHSDNETQIIAIVVGSYTSR